MARRIKVFLPDEDNVWLSAEIVREVKAGHYEIEWSDPACGPSPERKIITMKSLCRPLDALPLQNEGLPDSGVHDMVTLNYLHEGNIDTSNPKNERISLLTHTQTNMNNPDRHHHRTNYTLS